MSLFATVADVRNSLDNYPEMDTWLDRNKELSDEDRTAKQNDTIERFIYSKQRQMESDLHIKYEVVRIRSRVPDASQQIEPPNGYDVFEDPYDFWQTDYQHLGFMRLRRRPVLCVNTVSLRYGTNVQTMTYPAEWLRLDRAMGNLSIVPSPGTGWTALQLLSGQYLLPMLTGAWLHDRLPQLLMVDYTVGVGERPTSSKHEWMEHWLHLVNLTARQVLIEISDVIKPGLYGESVSEDGLSQSRQFTRGNKLKYQGKVDQYLEDYEVFKRDHRQISGPPLFTTV